MEMTWNTKSQFQLSRISAQRPIAVHGVKLALMRVFRTREFDEQGPSHTFGSVSVSIEF
jgi:hypothetical protein